MLKLLKRIFAERERRTVNIANKTEVCPTRKHLLGAHYSYRAGCSDLGCGCDNLVEAVLRVQSVSAS